MSVSLPAPPSSTLFAALPVMTLLPALPVPLIAVVPVSVRFSTLVSVASENVIDEFTVSVPAFASSVIVSVVVSTM